MADRVAKFLRALSPSDRTRVLALFGLIAANNLEGLDCQPLKGYDGVFRVRKGQMRIIFRQVAGSQNIIVAASYRDEQTYKNLGL